MRQFLLILSTILLGTTLLGMWFFEPNSFPKTQDERLEGSGLLNADSIRMSTEFPKQLKTVETYITGKAGKYSPNYAILIDMKIPSYHYRFFLVDLKKDSIVQRGLVAHGSGSETGKADSLVFSNTPNSYMTSLGIYKFGVAYNGSFGRSYRLHGLESSNSKAFDRAVVFHSYSYVPTLEQETPIMNSLGCPMVSPDFFNVIDSYVKKEKLPMLMKIYY